MKIIITKVEANRIVKYLSIEDDLANEKLNELIANYPDSFIYDGEYNSSLWVENGKVSIVHLIENTVIQSVVSMRQARLALLQFGLLATVDSAIAQGTEADKIEWEYATEVNRDTPLVQNMKVGINLSESDLDNLFTLAASL